MPDSVSENRSQKNEKAKETHPEGLNITLPDPGKEIRCQAVGPDQTKTDQQLSAKIGNLDELRP
ncbi:hypothetical protein JCM31598_23540 [Desulfonatronum parangueonense]